MAPGEVRLPDTTASGDWVLVGAGAPFVGLRLDPRNRVNRRAAALAVEFWSGTSWTAVSDLADGASVSGAALGRAGEVSFTEPAAWRPARIGGVRAYWLRFSATSVLDSGARLHSIAARQPRKADRFLVVGHELHAGVLRSEIAPDFPVDGRRPRRDLDPRPAGGRRRAAGHGPARAGRRALRGPSRTGCSARLDPGAAEPVRAAAASVRIARAR